MVSVKLALFLVLPALVTAQWAAQVGQAIADFNTGVAMSFQTNPLDTTSVCYVDATATGVLIINMFDYSTYTGGVITASELGSRLFSGVNLAFMQQSKDCGTSNILYMINNRLSDPSFTVGLISNVATQVATAITYYGLYTAGGFTIAQTLL